MTKYNYIDRSNGYALAQDETGKGFDVYMQYGVVYKRIGFILEKDNFNAINILKEIINDKYSENKSKR